MFEVREVFEVYEVYEGGRRAARLFRSSIHWNRFVSYPRIAICSSTCSGVSAGPTAGSGEKMSPVADQARIANTKPTVAVIQPGGPSSFSFQVAFAFDPLFFDFETSFPASFASE